LTAPAPQRRRPAATTAGEGRAQASKAPRRSARPGAAPPVLVRQLRNGIEESVHRGDVVEVDAEGRILRQLGDPDRLVTLRSAAKPFGVVALLEAGGREAFDLQPAEIALLAGSHSGEDVHVRTLQAVLRRAQLSQGLIATGVEGMPLDALTAARLARDGERPGPIRHMCSGSHTVLLLLARLRGWDPDGYWNDTHPAQLAYRDAVARAFGARPDRMRTAIDGCGLLTYAFPLRELARAYAMLAEPGALPADDERSALAEPLTVVRDAMIAHPEMVAGNRDRLDTAVMKAVPGRLLSKGGAEALSAVAMLGGSRNGATAGPSGLALKIEDGGGNDRAPWAASVEALRQAGVLDAAALRLLGPYHHPTSPDPHGRPAGEAVAEFDLAPVRELIR
jgi:L-asparaginase II